MPDPFGPATAGNCPDDVVDVLRPGDHASGGPATGTARCPTSWLDVQDLLGGDFPWRCSRERGHLGQHIAFSPHSEHVAAVLQNDM